MPRKFTTGKHAIAECDRCGFRYKLKELKDTTVNDKQTGLKVCPTCWEDDHPQNKQGRYPVNDPQAVENPRPDNSVPESNYYQWGWAPVGLSEKNSPGLDNKLLSTGEVGAVTVLTP